MKKIITILLMIFALSFSAFAQTENTKAESKCPNIVIIGPPSSVSEGQTMTFTIRIIGDDKEPKIKWSVDKGKIVSGQGKSSITVVTDDLDNETLVARVEVEGLAKECKSVFSENGIITGKLPCESLDDFGDIADNDVRARIDAFIAELQNNPHSIGVITQYGQPKVVRKRKKLIKDHFDFRSFDLSNITFKYIKKGKDFNTKLWRFRAGVEISCAGWEG